jgi:hypothetical protein
MLCNACKALEGWPPDEVCCTVALWVARHQVAVDKGVIKVSKVTQPHPGIWLGWYYTLK